MSVRNVVSGLCFSNSPFDSLPLNLTENSNRTLPNTETKVPREVSVIINGGDTPYKVEYRALWYAAKEAGLPQKERNEFAKANADGKFDFTHGDPTPKDDASAKPRDVALLVGKTLPYKLSNNQVADLQQRRDAYVERGGVLFSNKEVAKPTTQENFAVKNGYDQTSLTRAQVESQLPATNNLPAPSGVPVPAPAPTPLPDKSEYVSTEKVELPTTLENANKLSITIQTFIPMERVDAPNNPFYHSLAPVIGNFEGDGRDVDQRTVIKNGKQDNASYRTKQVIDVDFNMPEGVDIPCQSFGKAGFSRELSRWDNKTLMREDQASGETIQATARREGNIIIIEAKEDETNPLVEGAPAISYNLKIKIEKQADGTMIMATTGSHDHFPGYEMFVSRPGASETDKKLVYGFDPRTKDNTPLGLFDDYGFAQQQVITKTKIIPANATTEKKAQ